jgi:[ribosomal protein S5]-alanine N-acetyltransferase
VHLRHPQADDFEELLARYRSSRKHLAGLAPVTYDRAKFGQYLLSSEQESNANFVICRDIDGVIVGSIGLSQIFRKAFQNAYLGYQLFAGFTGEGYMTEAVATVLRYAFVEQKLHRIEANVQPQNQPSINVLKRCRFTKEGYSPKYLKIGGRWQDHERWAIIKEDWKAFKK